MAPMQGFFFSHPLITKYIQDAPSSGLFEDPQAKGNARFFLTVQYIQRVHTHSQTTSLEAKKL